MSNIIMGYLVNKSLELVFDKYERELYRDTWNINASLFVNKKEIILNET